MGMVPQFCEYTKNREIVVWMGQFYGKLYLNKDVNKNNMYLLDMT